MLHLTNELRPKKIVIVDIRGRLGQGFILRPHELQETVNIGTPRGCYIQNLQTSIF